MLKITWLIMKLLVWSGQNELGYNFGVFYLGVDRIWNFQIRPEPDLPDFDKNSGRMDLR